VLVVAALTALFVPAHGSAGQRPAHDEAADPRTGRHWAVGAPPGDFARVRAQLPHARVLLPGRAVVVVGTRPHVHGAQFVERIDGTRRGLAFDSTEPLADKQWYLPADRAWNYWTAPPKLATVRVAVIDSGIDYGHPEFAGRIAGGRSFVPGSWKSDADGHGTFVAGQIAASPFNGQGIAGLAFNAKLLIAKVVKPDGSVSLQAEIEAIRWAADRGARVINLSLGGVRDPADAELDTYSPAEHAAVEYAYSKGVVIVAAAGNGVESPRTPWGYADYPAALPHVIGVGALRRDGSVPKYSNRDVAFVDIAAPGDNVLSTVPRNLIDDTRALCIGNAYSDCGPFDFRNAIGTSFAAPQVAAAAALLIGQSPSLRPDQVSWLLERSALDETPATGCAACAPRRDSLTGWGALDVLGAFRKLAVPANLPPADQLEPNDNTDTWAHRLGRPRTIAATLDYWDDPVDVYAVTLAHGQRLYARLSSSSPTLAKVVLWRPGTKDVTGVDVPLENEAARSKAAAGAQQRLALAVSAGGLYYLEVKLGHPTRDPVSYTLAVATRR
jgi:subtilisin family serine protease